MTGRRSTATVALMVLTCVTLMTLASCRRTASTSRTFATPEDAVRALIGAAKAGALEEVVAIFGPDGQELVDSSDPATARRNRDVFTVAAAEEWQLVDQGSGRKVLVVGNEGWPFPVPLTKVDSGWRFDTAAGKEEVLDRRIGRNELMVITICRTYVVAQQLYAEKGHDGQPAGLYARTFRSDAGRENGLFWPSGRGQKRSPLGDLVATAAAEGRPIGNGWPAAVTVSRLLLQDPHRAGPLGRWRGEGLRGGWQDVGRLRARGVARAVRLHRRHDVHRQSGGHRSAKRTSVRDRTPRPGR